MAIRIPESFHSLSGFGKLVAYFPPRKAGQWAWRILAVVSFLIAGAVFIYGCTMAYLHAQRSGFAVIMDYLLWPGVITFMALLVCALAVWRGFRLNQTSAAVFEAGFAFLDRQALQSWRWTDLAGVCSALTSHYLLGIHIFTRHKYLLIRTDGAQLLMDDSIHHVSRLVQMINQASFALRLERALKRLNSSGGASFGLVKISQDRIRLTKQTLRWREIQRIVLKRGRLTFYSQQGRLSVGVAEIANLDVLVEMLNQRHPVQV